MGLHFKVTLPSPRTLPLMNFQKRDCPVSTARCQFSRSVEKQQAQEFEPSFISEFLNEDNQKWKVHSAGSSSTASSELQLLNWRRPQLSHWERKGPIRYSLFEFSNPPITLFCFFASRSRSSQKQKMSFLTFTPLSGLTVLTQINGPSILAFGLRTLGRVTAKGFSLSKWRLCVFVLRSRGTN